MRCGGCFETNYCAPECQKAHWPEHKLQCRQIREERGKKDLRMELGEKLIEASEVGNLPEVRRLLELGADPRFKRQKGEENDTKGQTPLHAATAGGHLRVMQALLDAGANPNHLAGIASISALYTAAARNQPRAIALLVRAGAKVDITSSEREGSWGGTPLNIAAQQGHKEAVIALLVAKAAVNHEAIDGLAPLHRAARNGHVDVLKLLIKAGGNVNQFSMLNPNSALPLVLASTNGHVECVEVLLAAGAGVGHLECTAALAAAVRSKQPAVEAVLRAYLSQRL